jgi:hypothetical protein
LEKSEREFEIDTRRKRIERERGSRERKRSGVVALRSPPLLFVLRRSPPEKED